mgnify:CR=1 FL=1
MSDEITNTHELMRSFRIVFARHEIAEMIGVSSVTVLRWEKRKHLASGRYAKRFAKAIDALADEFAHHPKVYDAIRHSLRVVTRERR